MLAALLALAVLLREVLLPFVAGMVLAYLLDPLANRLERLGMNRLLARWPSSLLSCSLLPLRCLQLFQSLCASLISSMTTFRITSDTCMISPPTRRGPG